MNIKILQSKALGFVVAEVLTSNEDGFYVANPRSLQVSLAPEKGGYSLNIHLLPLVQKELLVEGHYECEFSSDDYIDVTDRFKPQIIEIYRQAENPSGSLEKDCCGKSCSNSCPEDSKKCKLEEASSCSEECGDINLEMIE